MATVSRDTVFTVPATSATNQNERTVNDKCRNLFPGHAKLSAFVTNGQVVGGEMRKSPGMIGKKSSKTIKVEGFTYTPIAITFTVTSLSSTTLTLVSSSGLCARLTLVNTANNTCARVDSYTSGTVVEVTSFGSTAFAASAGDVLLCMGPAYESGSSTPNYLSKDDDNLYNICQILRYPSAISGSAIAEKTLLAQDYWTRNKEKTMIEGNRRTENTMIFSDRASSGEATTGGAVYGSDFRTMKGVWNWAANTFPCGGAMTYERFITDLVNAMADTVDDGARILMLGGNAIYGNLLTWVSQKLMYMDPKGGEIDTFGAKTTKFRTSRFDIEYLKHDAFNRGSNTTRALLMCPDEWIYYYLEGRDFQVVKNIQAPSMDGQEDEIKGEICLCPADGGYSTLSVTDWSV